MHLKISFAKWWPFCPGGDELTLKSAVRFQEISLAILNDIIWSTRGSPKLLNSERNVDEKMYWLWQELCLLMTWHRYVPGLLHSQWQPSLGPVCVHIYTYTHTYIYIYKWAGIWRVSYIFVNQCATHDASFLFTKLCILSTVQFSKQFQQKDIENFRIHFIRSKNHLTITFPVLIVNNSILRPEILSYSFLINCFQTCQPEFISANLYPI